jgi:hypothetical protein
MTDTITLPRAVGEQALHVATTAGYPVALIAALRKALEQPEPEQADWTHLKRYGYAPGNYMSKCHRCGETISGLDKRAVTCKPCAEARHAFEQAEQEQEPVAWSDARLRGIASDYFPSAKDWPAAMLCLRHLLMEQAKYPPASAPEQDPLFVVEGGKLRPLRPALLNDGDRLYTAQPRREPLTVTELQKALVDVLLVDPDAIDDPEGYDGGMTLIQIDALHKRLTEDQT